jgi:hypothetical protein
VIRGKLAALAAALDRAVAAENRNDLRIVHGELTHAHAIVNELLDIFAKSKAPQS